MALVELRVGRLDAGTDAVARFHGLIDRDEQTRAARFRFERDRRRFIVRRGLLRLWLGAITGTAPGRLTFAAGPGGKPALIGEGPRFSLSRSGESLLLATAAVEVGCDIEQIDPEMDWRAVAARFFATSEVDSLYRLPAEAGRRAFFDCWTRKEAFVKAIGQGLAHPLDAFVVAIGEETRLLAGGGGWSIAATPLAPSCAGAVVARDDGDPLVLRTMIASEA